MRYNKRLDLHNSERIYCAFELSIVAFSVILADSGCDVNELCMTTMPSIKALWSYGSPVNCLGTIDVMGTSLLFYYFIFLTYVLFLYDKQHEPIRYYQRAGNFSFFYCEFIFVIFASTVHIKKKSFLFNTGLLLLTFGLGGQICLLVLAGTMISLTLDI